MKDYPYCFLDKLSHDKCVRDYRSDIGRILIFKQKTVVYSQKCFKTKSMYLKYKKTYSSLIVTEAKSHKAHSQY